MPFDVFISYATPDKQVADAVCARLESAGVRCWIAPRDIMPGSEYGAAIVAAIHEARLLVLVFSAYADRSPQIRREVERAVSRGVPIVPLRIENIAPTQSLEYFIGTVHWLDALTVPIDEHLQRLGDAVQALLRLDAPSDNGKLATSALEGIGGDNTTSIGMTSLGTRWTSSRKIGAGAIGVFLALGGFAGVWFVRSSANLRDAQCEDLWIARNSYYKAHGLCFKTERAKKHFANAGCSIDDPVKVYEKLSNDERGQVLDLREKERKLGCP